MKKFIKTLMVMFLFSILLGCSVHVVNADTTLKEGKEYKVDLNGDKKEETIVFKETGMDKYGVFSIYKLYINGKKVKSVNGYVGYCKILDINKKTKGKEIIFYATSDSNCVEDFNLYQYKNKKLKKIARLDISGKYNIYRISGNDGISTDSKGTLSIVVDTPVNIANAGCYYSKVNFQLKNGKLKLKDTTIIKFNKVKNWDYNKYVLASGITLRKSTDMNSNVVAFISAGQSVKILKVKLDGKKESGEYGNYYGYAYIEDSKGNKGWLYLNCSQTESLFSSYPAWG